MVPSLSLHVQEPAAPEKPWVVLIHGLGMSHRAWIDPFGERLLRGAISFDYVLTDLRPSSTPSKFSAAGLFACSPPLRFTQPPPLSFWEFLKRGGYGILTWSQEKSRGPIEHAIGELQTLLTRIPHREKKVLLGHSRGGLVARKYLQERRPGWDRVSGVVLLGAPNHGSRIAKLSGILECLSPLFGAAKNPHSQTPKKNESGFYSLLIRTLAEYPREGAIDELAPRSEFIRALTSGEREERKNKIPYFSLIGTRTDFIRIYLRPSSAGRAKPIFSLFDSLERILPRFLIPVEIQQGRGDGQVSVKSAHLLWAERTQLLPVNHAQFLVDTEVRIKTKSFLKTL